MKPSVGRIVHCLGGRVTEPRVAIVVAVNEHDSVNLQLFSDCHAPLIYMADIPHESNAAGDLFWRWPPRVDE